MSPGRFGPNATGVQEGYLGAAAIQLRENQTAIDALAEVEGKLHGTIEGQPFATNPPPHTELATSAATHPIGAIPARAEQATVTSDPQIEELRAENPKLVGVGGWLAWFCVAVTFISPLIFLGEAINSKDPLVWVLDVALTGWYVFTGVTLWRQGRHALRYVTIVLIIQFCLGVLILIGSVTASQGSSAQSDAPAGIRALMGAFLWYLYFHFSKRVRLTFGRNI